MEKLGVGGERWVCVVGLTVEYVGAVCAGGVAYTVGIIEMPVLTDSTPRDSAGPLLTRGPVGLRCLGASDPDRPEWRCVVLVDELTLSRRWLRSDHERAGDGWDTSRRGLVFCLASGNVTLLLALLVLLDRVCIVLESFAADLLACCSSGVWADDDGIDVRLRDFTSLAARATDPSSGEDEHGLASDDVRDAEAGGIGVMSESICTPSSPDM
jgi:hypothetical protein